MDKWRLLIRRPRFGDRSEWVVLPQRVVWVHLLFKQMRFIVKLID